MSDTARNMKIHWADVSSPLWIAVGGETGRSWLCSQLLLPPHPLPLLFLLLLLLLFLQEVEVALASLNCRRQTPAKHGDRSGSHKYRAAPSRFNDDKCSLSRNQNDRYNCRENKCQSHTFISCQTYKRPSQPMSYGQTCSRDFTIIPHIHRACMYAHTYTKCTVNHANQSTPRLQAQMTPNS